MFNYFYSQVRSGLQRIFDLYHSSKGSPSVVQSIQDPKDATRLIASTSAGYQIEIVCTEISYVVKYPQGFGVFDKCQRIFQVHCECCEGTPDDIKTFFSIMHTVPDLTMRMTSLKHKRRAAIVAYLQMVSADLVADMAKRDQVQKV
jgi:hypothetical protein